MLPTYNGILFSLKKEGNFDTQYNMGDSWIHYAKWSKPGTKGQILCDSFTRGTQSNQFHRKKGGCQGIGKGSTGSYCLMDAGFQFGKMKEIRDGQWSWLHEDMNELNDTELYAAAKSLQSCPTLCDPTDGSPPGSPVPGILQTRTLEWVAMSFSNAWKWKVKVKSLSRVRLLATPWTAAHQVLPSIGFSRQEYWNGVPLPSLI